MLLYLDYLVVDLLVVCYQNLKQFDLNNFLHLILQVDQECYKEIVRHLFLHLLMLYLKILKGFHLYYLLHLLLL